MCLIYYVCVIKLSSAIFLQTLQRKTMEEQNNALRECFARLASHIIIINMLQTVPCGAHIVDLQLHCFFIVMFTIGHISIFSFILHLIPMLLCGQKGFGSSCYWAPALTTPSTLTTPPTLTPPPHTQHPISQFQVPHPLSRAKHPSRPNPRSHLIMQWNVRRRQNQRQRGALLVWHRPEGQEYVARHFSFLTPHNLYVYHLLWNMYIVHLDLYALVSFPMEIIFNWMLYQGHTVEKWTMISPAEMKRGNLGKM